MSLIKILQYPDPRLKRIAIPVETFNKEVEEVIDNMFQTLYATPRCAALAATQLDLPTPWRITVIDLSNEKNAPLCLVNAHIIEATGEQLEYEGCMSIHPDLIQDIVKRAMNIKVKYQDREGKHCEMEASGYLAKCIQHELDHLDGKVYINRLNKIKQDRLHRKIKLHLRELKNK